MSTSLAQDVAGTGYYPALANHVLNAAIAGEKVVAHFVQAETTFDTAEVRRHMTIAVVTRTRLLRVHIDDGAAQENATHEASATVETAFLRTVNSVAVTHVVQHPERFKEGDLPHEVVLAVGWGVHSRLDLEPATCGDTSCDADHGYTGAVSGDDTIVRVSTIADGPAAVRSLEAFAAALQRAVGEAR